tara:strand:- start:305 stop:982 length:678 start_codon:yes stop_codon:yes gene_type:complete
MELSKEQLLQIDNYIFVCGVKYHDVRAEIVDHFANILEQKLDENPDLNFKKEIENSRRNFSVRGFSKLLEEKTKSVTRMFYKQSLKHLITFFKIPKIIIIGGLFFALFQMMNLFEDKKTFFYILTSLGFVLVLLNFIKISMNKKLRKELFLKLDMNAAFLPTFNFLVICFNSITNFRSSESFLNVNYNSVQLTIFVLLVLFYWSANYVYYQNKKLVKEQYPNILV